MDALETMLLEGRSETSTIDTLTARRLDSWEHGSLRRRRSRQKVSALRLDSESELVAQHGTTPRISEKVKLKSVGDTKEDNVVVVGHGQFELKRFPWFDMCVDRSHLNDKGHGNTPTLQMPLQRSPNTTQERPQILSNFFRHSTLRPRANIPVSARRNPNLGHPPSLRYSTRSQGNTPSSALFSKSDAILLFPSTSSVGKKEISLVQFALATIQNVSSPKTSSTSSSAPPSPPSLPEISNLTEKPIPHHKNQTRYSLKDKRQSSSTRSSASSHTLRPSIPAVGIARDPMPHQVIVPLRLTSLTTAASSSSASTKIPSDISSVRSTTSSLSSVTYSTTEDSDSTTASPERHQDGAEPKDSPHAPPIRKQRVLSAEEFQIAIKLWNFDVSQTFRAC